VKRLDQVAGDLRFADVAGCSQILSSSNEFDALVNGEKDDAGRASAASQLFRDSKATYIAQIHVQKNNVWVQSGRFFKHGSSGRKCTHDCELGLQQIHQDFEHIRAVVYTQESFHF
jgi:hypothetical protein